MHIYTNGGEKCARISEAFAKGSGFEVVPAKVGLQPGVAACYGMLRGLKAVLDAARREGRDWYYLDNAYFGREKFFRVTKNALQMTGAGVRARGMDRLYDLALPWLDWRMGPPDGHILIAQQEAVWYELIGQGNRDAWTDRTVAELKRHTERPIRIRTKGTDVPLADDLVDCWALVTHSSNAAVDAIVAGVPVFATGQSAAAPLARSDLSMIERPILYEDRLHWAASLAANQWTLDEMRDGTCWRDLQGVG